MPQIYYKTYEFNIVDCEKNSSEGKNHEGQGHKRHRCIILGDCFHFSQEQLIMTDVLSKHIRHVRQPTV